MSPTGKAMRPAADDAPDKSGARARSGAGGVRELLFFWNTGGLNVLVPKTRGIGFLKVPLGHHAVPFFRDLECELGCDICGLDGCLEFDCGMQVSVYEERRVEYAAKVIPILAKHYGCEFREVGSREFFAVLKGGGCAEPAGYGNRGTNEGPRSTTDQALRPVEETK